MNIKNPLKQSTFKKNLNSILIKPAGPDCNLACDYCFYLEKRDLFPETKTHRMSEPILEEMIRQAMEQAGSNIHFAWQGGEPTLMGLPFFQKAVDLQQKYGRDQMVGNALQTNGYLIDDNWIDFLKKYNFLVGLSLDGPEEIHNHYRHLKNGQGSWHKTVEQAQKMLNAGVAVNALSVVNDVSAQHPNDIYGFLKSIGFSYMQFIPIVETDRSNPGQAMPYSVSAENYGDFLCKIFDLWMVDFSVSGPTTSVRFFESLLFNYVNLKSPECTLTKECGEYIVVEHNGDVFSCDFFVEPDWHLGNVMMDRLDEMLNSEKQTRFGQMKAELPEECKTCKWLNQCYGGCTKDRLRDPRDNGNNHFCQSYKKFFEYTDSRIQKLADDWKRQQAQNLSAESLNKKSKIAPNDLCPCGSGKKYKKCCGNILIQ